MAQGSGSRSPSLSASDSDGDGLANNVEGSVDENGNGLLDYLDVTRHDHAARAHDPDVVFRQNFKDRTIIYARNEDTIFAVDG